MNIRDILKERFEKSKKNYEDISWEDIVNKLDEKAISALTYMEESGGSPAFLYFDEKNDKYVFCDFSKEEVESRRSICYDEKALAERKKNKPLASCQGICENHGIDLMTEEEYFYLQSLGDFDQKTSCWLKTPEDIRSKGGALFGSKKYSRTFIYHNGADSYYGVRGFRAVVRV